MEQSWPQVVLRHSNIKYSHPYLVCFQHIWEWKYTMLMPNGRPFIAEGVYKEIVFHKRICSMADFKPMTQGVEIQSIFKDMGDKTEFTFYVVHPTEEYKIQQEKMGIQNGGGSEFTRLEEFLNEINI